MIISLVTRRAIMNEIIKNRRKISEIAEDMVKINRRRPTEEELDKLVEILNESTGESEDVDDTTKRIARKSDNNGIEQSWI
jgi:hypothetical protein